MVRIGRNKNNPSSNNGGNEKCKYSLEREGKKIKIVVQCEGCTGRGYLNDQRCLRGVLKILSDEFTVDSIVIRHIIEKEYNSDATELLKRFAGFINILEQLSLRDPMRDRGCKSCLGCDFNPQKIYATLINDFVTKDIARFYTQFKNIAWYVNTEGIQNNNGTLKPVCKEYCIPTTASDIVHLYGKLDELRAFIFRGGYKISSIINENSHLYR